MRVIAGYARGRRIQSVKGRDVRPSSDKVREAVFQILTLRLDRPWEDVRVLDLYAGTGALGIEALSRGARSAVFVDGSPAALNVVRRNLDLCGFTERARIIRAEIGRSLKRLQSLLPDPFELVLVDPPYAHGLGEKVLACLADTRILAPGGTAVIEESARVSLPETITGTCEGPIVIDDRRCYGGTGVWFYKKIGIRGVKD